MNRCERCESKPCQNNPHNSDQECWGLGWDNKELLKELIKRGENVKINKRSHVAR